MQRQWDTHIHTQFTGKKVGVNNIKFLAVCESLRDNSNDTKCQTLFCQFSSSLIWSTQPVILAIQISHAWPDLVLMVVIIIKWSVMTTDNPHVHPGFAERQLFVNAPLKPKTHTDVCGTKPQTQLRALPLSECMLVLNFYRLAYGNFAADVQLFSTGPPH